MLDESTHTEMIEALNRFSDNGTKPLPIIRGHAVNPAKNDPLRITIGLSDQESGILTVLGIVHSTALNGGTAIVAPSGIFHLGVNRTPFLRAINLFLHYREDKGDVMDLCGAKEWELPKILEPYDQADRSSADRIGAQLAGTLTFKRDRTIAAGPITA